MAEPEQESGTPASDENNAKMEESDLNASASEMTVDQTSTVLSSLSLEESQGTVLSSLSLEEEIEGDGEEEKGGEERGGSEEVNQRNPGAEEEEWQDILGNGLLMKKVWVCVHKSQFVTSCTDFEEGGGDFYTSSSSVSS